MDTVDRVGSSGGQRAVRPLVIAGGVLLAAVLLVAVTVFVVSPASVLPPAINAASLNGRWVRTGDACDTKRGDLVITPTSITHHEFGILRSDMLLAATSVKSPGVIEVKFTSKNGTFVGFATFTMKDTQTFVLNNYLFADGVWRKC